MVDVASYGGWPAILKTVTVGEDLTPGAAEAALAEILQGRATDAQISALIVSMRLKGESVEELIGMSRAMVAAATPLEVPEAAIDIVGTGGSASQARHALSVSTMASFVAAGAGALVCKHGSVKASSTSGAFDTLEALGVAIHLDGPGVVRCMEEAGAGFVFAKAFHMAMRHAGPVRSQIGIPTMFNQLGPLSHPGRVVRHVIGVSDAGVQPVMAAVLARRGSHRGLVVRGYDGLDEITVTSPTRVMEVRDGRVVGDWVVDPVALGLRLAKPEDLAGGSPEDNARIARSILAGEDTGPRADMVALNAAAGLMVAGMASDLAEGLAMARESISSGAAQRVLADVVRVSNQVAGG